MAIRTIYKEFYGTDEHGWQIKDYFNGMYQSGKLEFAIKKILNKEDCCFNVLQCRFPDDHSCEEYDHFEGVEFEMGYFDDDSEIIVSEKECLTFVEEAIFLYEEKHPDRKGFADADLEKSTLGR